MILNVEAVSSFEAAESLRPRRNYNPEDIMKWAIGIIFFNKYKQDKTIILIPYLIM
jgi:hypothetical protein